MLRIGYLRQQDTGRESAALEAMGCHVVRAEDDPETEAQPVLASILEFIGEGDELVAPSLAHLGRSAKGMLDLLERLEQRGASLVAADPPVVSKGESGRALRAVLEAVAAFEPSEPVRRRARAPAHEIRALQRAGIGPVEIARRLGVSRMTVWRKLKSLDA
jgi:DNA invertase Pin-like site-specific DNA recombinase